jgi:2'-5' RNA ligase
MNSPWGNFTFPMGKIRFPFGENSLVQAKFPQGKKKRKHSEFSPHLTMQMVKGFPHKFPKGNFPQIRGEMSPASFK